MAEVKEELPVSFLYLHFRQRCFHVAFESENKPGWELLAKDCITNIGKFLDSKRSEKIFGMSLATAREFYWGLRYKPSRPLEQHASLRKSTWIYLMKDLRSGYIKIGNSIQPRYRESTLQAEQPLIELLYAWEGTGLDERVLHQQYKDQRLRGEWFDLDDKDIHAIAKRFEDRRQYTQ